jgi:hypothetical protein
LLFFGRILRSVLIPSSLNEFRFAKFVEPRELAAGLWQGQLSPPSLNATARQPESFRGWSLGDSLPTIHSSCPPVLMAPFRKMEPRGLSKAALWLRFESFAFNPCA